VRTLYLTEGLYVGGGEERWQYVLHLLEFKPFMMKLEFLMEVRIRGGIVGIATALRAGRFRVRILGGEGICLIQNFQTGSGARILFSRYRGSFPGGKAAGK
jgi:hypothetical protein